jgi:medium-chain acyl-[acyl-carrier-protein] hydrolase
MSTSLPPWVELSILQLPGREALFGSPMYLSMKSLIAALAPVVLPQTNEPYAFFGHSLGAHVAFELARKIRNHNKPLPRGLLASGSRAPHLPLRRKPLHQLPTPELIGELRRYGGTPEAVLQNQELMDLFLPPLRADLCVFETMEYEAGVPFDFPIAAFGGRTDHRTDLDEIEAWREHTTGRFTVEFFEGGHFYLMEQSKTVFSAALRQTITDLV